MYTGEMYVTSNNAHRLLNLCTFLNLTEAKDLCDKFILDNKEEDLHTVAGICKSGMDFLPQDPELGNDSDMSITGCKSQHVTQSQYNNESAIMKIGSTEINSSDMSQINSTNVSNVGIDSHCLNMEGHDYFAEKFERNDNKSRTDIKLVIRVTDIVSQGEDSDYFKNVTLDEVVTQGIQSVANSSTSTGTSTEKNRVTQHQQKLKLNSKLKMNKVKGNACISKPKRKGVKRKLSNQTNYDKTSDSFQSINRQDADILQHPAEKKRKTKYNIRTCCRVCKTDFVDVKSLHAHRDSVHLLVCSVCSWTSNRGSNMAGHMFVQHGVMYNEEKYPLNHCDYPVSIPLTSCSYKLVY